MSHRYAVLWSLNNPVSMPIGIAVEQDGHVLVDVPEHLCVPARYRGEYRVLQPDSDYITYRPGHEGYFEQVLIDLSRMFAIGERGEIPAGDPATIIKLLREKVLQPLQEKRLQQYEPAASGPRYAPRTEPVAQEPTTDRACAELVGV